MAFRWFWIGGLGLLAVGLVACAGSVPPLGTEGVAEVV
jgi:hypothetical protein